MQDDPHRTCRESQNISTVGSPTVCMSLTVKRATGEAGMSSVEGRRKLGTGRNEVVRKRQPKRSAHSNGFRAANYNISARDLSASRHAQKHSIGENRSQPMIETRYTAKYTELSIS